MKTKTYELTVPAKEYRTPKGMFKLCAFGIAFELSSIISLLLTHVLYGDNSTISIVCYLILTVTGAVMMYMPFRYIACTLWDVDNDDV